MIPEDRKIYHHHTPRYYLLPWADVNERVWWLGWGKVRLSGLTVVGGENDFYRLQELSERDEELLRNFIKKLPYASEANLKFLTAFTMPHKARRKLLAMNPASIIKGESVASRLDVIDRMLSNFVEDYHAGIENSFWPFVLSMLGGDTTFFEDPKQASQFLYGLMVQFVRTKRPRDLIGSAAGPFENPGAVWTIMHHMIAASTGASFFLDRARYKLILIENRTNVPFITGDQPVINLRVDLGSTAPPEAMEFYYPLSPTKAMLFLEIANPLHSIERIVSADEAHAYNLLILGHSRQQVFSNSEDYLRLLFRNASATNPPPQTAES